MTDIVNLFLDHKAPTLETAQAYLAVLLLLPLLLQAPVVTSSSTSLATKRTLHSLKTPSWEDLRRQGRSA
jgi:hypothetical protein